MAFISYSLLRSLGAEAGAASRITYREATGDRSVTIDRDEKRVLELSYPEMNFPRRGGGNSINETEEFYCYVHPYNDLRTSTVQKVSIVYPKKDKSELRLYFSELSKFTIDKWSFRSRESQGLFPYWYVYKIHGEDYPHIGMADASLLRINDKRAKIRESSADAIFQSILQNAVKSDLAGEKVSGTVFRYQRSFKQSIKALTEADFICEVDSSHETFLSAASGQPYVEGHHLIPLSFQKDFQYKLDVKENIVALCPNCHRLLHHGTHEDKISILSMLLSERIDLLNNKNIGIDEETLLEYYL